MLDIYKECLFNRYFEEKVAYYIRKKKITVPTYLSVGGEFIPLLVKHALEKYKISRLNIFGQHRVHSWYLTFIQNPQGLALELLGNNLGCNKAMGGSASIAGENEKYKMWGHDGLLGSQVPIGVGHAFASNEFTVIIMGDGACEEDWICPSLAFAAEKKLPILFIVENNNLSITTPVNERRQWKILEVAEKFGVRTREYCSNFEIELKELDRNIYAVQRGLPWLIEYNIERHYWHVGGGNDGSPKYDYIHNFRRELIHQGHWPEDLSKFEQETKSKIDELWGQLEI